jgi:hypothetical protein
VRDTGNAVVIRVVFAALVQRQLPRCADPRVAVSCFVISECFQVFVDAAGDDCETLSRYFS